MHGITVSLVVEASSVSLILAVFSTPKQVIPLDKSHKYYSLKQGVCAEKVYHCSPATRLKLLRAE